MMKKIIKITLAATFAFSAAALAACGDTHDTHTWGEWESRVSATCERDGTELRKCTGCDEFETRKIEGGHLWSDWIVLQEVSCQSEGSKTRTCRRDATHTETVTLPLDPDAHVWRASVYETRPTCTQSGKQLFICEHDTAHRSWETVDEAHNWGEWTLTKSPSCATEGEKSHVCNDCGETETEAVLPLGHTYENGKCDCGDGPIYPETDKDIVYLSPNNPEDGIEGAGEDYNRFQMKEGYYQIEIPDTREVWLAFSASQAGQYALYSLENTGGVTATRYDASEQFIPAENFPAAVYDGNFYSSVDASPRYWSGSWRATYRLQGKSGSVVKLRFVRIADSPRVAENIIEYAVPEQLKLEKAPNGANGTILREVAYDDKYTYNKADGYYYTESGNLLYVAITKNADRLFPDCSFATMVTRGGSYLLHHSTTVDGNYLLKDYSWFLTNHGGKGYMDENRNFILNEGDPTLPCYQNYVNSDGLYPVNQELFEFLNLYVNANPVADANSNVAWLAACYEYVNAIPGSEDFPYEVTESFSVTTKRSGFTYYKLLPSNGITKYIVSVEGETNGYLHIDGKKYENAFSLAVDVGTKGLTFYAASLEYNQSVTFNVIVTPVQDGDAANPLTLGDNAITVSITNGYPTPVVCAFTAEKSGKYRLFAADGETNADIYDGKDTETWIENLPHEFELTANASKFFTVSTFEFLATEDVVDIVIEYYDEEAQAWIKA